MTSQPRHSWGPVGCWDYRGPGFSCLRLAHKDVQLNPALSKAIATWRKLKVDHFDVRNLWLSILVFTIYLSTLSVVHKVFSGWQIVNIELERMWKEVVVVASFKSLHLRVLGGVFLSSTSWDSWHCLNIKLDQGMNIYIYIYIYIHTHTYIQGCW